MQLIGYLSIIFAIINVILFVFYVVKLSNDKIKDKIIKEVNVEISSLIDELNENADRNLTVFEDRILRMEKLLKIANDLLIKNEMNNIDTGKSKKNTSLETKLFEKGKKQKENFTNNNKALIAEIGDESKKTAKTDTTSNKEKQEDSQTSFLNNEKEEIKITRKLNIAERAYVNEMNKILETMNDKTKEKNDNDNNVYYDKQDNKNIKSETDTKISKSEKTVKDQKTERQDKQEKTQKQQKTVKNQETKKQIDTEQEKNKESKPDLQEGLENCKTNREKIQFLMQNGKTIEEIEKLTSLSKGEIELITVLQKRKII